MPHQHSETLQMTACAGDDVISEFQITFRFEEEKPMPISGVVAGVEISEELATILYRAIVNVPA